MASKPKSILEDWLPDRPLPWLAGFALLYVVVFLVQDRISGLVDVLPGRIAVVFLPAFVRVVAVVVAGLAGAAGISLGSVVINAVLYQQPWEIAGAVAIASGLGVFLSYWTLRMAFGEKLPLTLPMLMVLAVLYSAFNAMIHGLAWELLGFDQQATMADLALMMVGDLAGVVLAFALLSLFLRRLPLFAKPVNK